MSSSPTEVLIDVTMPQMGVSVAEGTVVEWKKQPGDWVEADEIIASISTDKIDTDVEAPASGRVQEVLVEAGATVDVGVVLARIATDAKPGEAHVSEADSSSGGTSEADDAMEAAGDAPDLSGDTTETHSGTAQRGTPEVRRSGPRRYSPVVMRIAAEHGIDLEQVEGTGRGGRVRKPDVLAFLEGNGARGEAGDEAPAEAVVMTAIVRAVEADAPVRQVRLRAAPRGAPCRSPSWAARPRTRRRAGTCRARSAA